MNRHVRQIGLGTAAALLLAAAQPSAAATKSAPAKASMRTRSSNWSHYHSFVTERPPRVAQQWENLSPEQRRLFEDGVLDVTIYDGWEGNAVDPAGVRDCTQALNRAIEIGRDFDLVVYFPAGTYLVSDMLNCRHTAYVRQTRRGDWIAQGSRRHTCKLYGDRKSRPVIRLKDGAARFGDPKNPQCVVVMWKQGDPENLTDYRTDYPASHYYGIIDGITIDCGRNPGAIGLYWKGAQGGMVVNTKIVATHAYAGLEGGSWATGGVYDLEVEGGRYGVRVSGNPPCYVGLTLRNQSEAALAFDGAAGSITLCGFRIEKAAGPVLKLPGDGGYRSSVHGNLLLMDGTIALSAGGTALDNAVGKNLYMENVYVRGATAVLQSAGDPPVPCGSGWTHIAEYRYCNKGVESVDGGWGKLVCPSDALIDGQVTKQTALRANAAAAAPPSDLVERHLWGKLPEYGDGDPTVVNAVRDLGLDNTGKTSVRAALQAAIDKHEKIFLPKGRYMLDGTVTLRANTKLFSASPNNTEFVTDPEWKPATETPILTTEDAPDGTAVLSGFKIQYNAAPAGTYHFNVLTWRVGRRSVLKQIVGSPDWMDVATTPGYPLSSFRIRDGGGGRWYSCIHEHKGETKDPDYHILAIENTCEPLTLYHYGGIHSQGGAQTLLRNARNIRFIGYNLEPAGNDIYHAIDSKNIGFYGFGNHTVRKRALVRLTHCEDVLCAMFAQPKDLRSKNTGAYQVLEERDGANGGRGITGDRVLCVFKRGQFKYPE
ncbi:MAG: hypothetical protein JXR37_36795 [Kiritimatiellae bacterium]|nr:hypothetical protein [Kiritimatiellia bacterium]